MNYQTQREPRPLAILAGIAGGIGLLIIIIAQATIPGIIDDTLYSQIPDLSGPTMWTWIGGGLLSIGAGAFLLALLMVEVRAALQTRS